jgi:hypothetical protein
MCAQRNVQKYLFGIVHNIEKLKPKSIAIIGKWINNLRYFHAIEYYAT